MNDFDFVHLHVHTEYSLLDGACRIQKLFDQVKKNKQKAIAITDHGVMYGVVDFYKQAKKQGIKPIIGCEMYVASRSRFEKDSIFDGKNYHLILLCKNEIGYQNLIYLVSKANMEGFYKRPRIDRELLSQHSEGLIAMSACISGEIPAKLLAGDEQGAVQALLFYKQLFGEDFYIELQNHGIDAQMQVMPKLISLADQYNIELVATNDAHYINKSDSKMQQVLNCIALGKTVQDGTGMEFQTDEFYLKDTQEMASLFSHVPQAINNTKIIADKCNFDFEFGVTKLPDFKSPTGDNLAYFKEMCHTGLSRRYNNLASEQLVSRLNYEIDTIAKMGFVDYFLIVQDFIAYAKKSGIPVGPGRGSGAGSLAAYCIGITDVDPIQNNLLFERFLNPERVSMPDFDVDFCYERRGEVIDYVTRKYGDDHVCQIITFGTLAARAAVRDVARALGKSYAIGDLLAKLVPRELHITIEKALEKSKDLMAQYRTSPDAKEILDMAVQVEGMPRHASTHAAGVVISKLPVYKYVPLQLNDNQLITQFPMTTLEELGLLKMDFLGLRTVTVIDDAAKQISKTDPLFDLEKIDVQDSKTFQMLSEGDTLGVFQFESDGMRRVLSDLKPTKMEDLTAVLSLYRPGPMEFIPTYIDNSKNPNKVTYQHPLLQDILDVTYGVIVYQEQVMQICRKLAGFSYGQADIVRRAMSKKKLDVMERERKHFLFGDNTQGSTCVGAIKNGVPQQVANEIFDQMQSFASYAFNKSHAACYAHVAYQTAFLKCHYPKEYFAALLTSVMDSTGKLVEYMGACSAKGIVILPPEINQSTNRFVASTNHISFSLVGIKGLGRGVIEQIIQMRDQDGAFASLYDFVLRMKKQGNRQLSRKTVESMILCGCFDQLHPNRRQAYVALDDIFNHVDSAIRQNIAGQISLFDSAAPQEFQMPKVDDFTTKEKIAYEREILGTYMSAHPLDEYAHLAKSTTKISQLIYADEKMDNQRFGLLVVLSDCKYKTTKTGTEMLSAVAEDKSGSMEIIAFSKVVQEGKRLLQNGLVVSLFGRLSLKEDEAAKLIVEKVSQVQITEPPLAKTVYIRVSQIDDIVMDRMEKLAFRNPGEHKVVLYDESTKKYLKCKPFGIDLSPICKTELCERFQEKNIVIKP